jgi:hypothetical protein
MRLTEATRVGGYYDYALVGKKLGQWAMALAKHVNYYQ